MAQATLPIRLRLGLTSVLLLAIAALGCVQAASPMIAPREAPGWTRVRGSHFAVTTDLGVERARRFAADLETFTALLRRLTGPQLLPAIPLEILVFADPSAFERYRLQGGQEGLFISDGNRSFVLMGDAAFSYLTRQKLFHEFTHYLMSETARAAPYPLWYGEGIAEFMSTAHWSAGSSAIGLPPARIPGDRALRRWLPVARILSLRDINELEAQDRSLFYSESWALVHYLQTAGRKSGSSRLPELVKYLRRVRQGVPWRRAARQSFQGGVPALEAELREYWRKTESGVAAFLVDPAELEIAESEPPRRAPQSEVDALLVELEAVLARVQGQAPEEHAR